MNTQTTEKIQKVLANLGLGSRRQIETWIEDGRIKVDGVTAKLGDRIGPNAKVLLDSKPIRLRGNQTDKTRVLLYNKPEGEIATRHDPQGRPTVFEHLPLLRHQRWIQVGRLDINTSGLLIFTTNGELANRMMHPSSQAEREYAVRVLGEVTPEVIKNLTQGVMLEDGPAKFNDLRDAGGTGANHWYHVILTEGRNREVRRLWESQGITVSRLIRVRFDQFTLPPFLKHGRWMELEEKQVEQLLYSYKLS